MKKCIVCLKEIEDSASECKYCGSYQVDLDEDFLSDDYDSKIQEEIKKKMISVILRRMSQNRTGEKWQCLLKREASSFRLS